MNNQFVCFGEGARQRIRISNQADFGNYLSRQQMVRPVHVRSWGLIYPKREEPCVRNLHNYLKRAMLDCGIQMNDAHTMSLEQDRSQNYIQAIRCKDDNVRSLRFSPRVATWSLFRDQSLKVSFWSLIFSLVFFLASC